jgi:hypothetical protein
MRIITLACEECGSIVAGNVLEQKGRVDCPGPNCDQTLQIETLTDDEQRHLLNNAEKYSIE